MTRLAPRWGWHHRPATAVWTLPPPPPPPPLPTQYRLVAAVGRLRMVGRPAALTWNALAFTLSAAQGPLVLTGRVARLLRDAVVVAETSPRGAITDEGYARILDEDGNPVMPDA